MFVHDRSKIVDITADDCKWLLVFNVAATLKMGFVFQVSVNDSLN